jgi:hypothetical protein
MRAVKLVFVKSFVDVPTVKDTFSAEVEFVVPDGFQNMQLIAARVYEDEVSAKSPTTLPGGDHNALIVDGKDFSYLMGKLLTYIEATYSDAEQRKAHKDIVKNILWDFEHDMRERAVQTVDSQSTGGALYPVKSTSITRNTSGQTMGNDDKGSSVLDPKVKSE